MKGLIVFYINVGDMTPKAADKYVEKVKADNAETLGAIPDEWGVVFLQVRNEMTRVETTPPFDR